MKITSRYGLGQQLVAATQDTIKSESMLYRADLDFAARHGGPLTQAFLTALRRHDGWNEKLVIDSRVHMLMPGMYPCIPGWHHDDVPRERSDGQPEYFTPSYRPSHCMALWGNCSLTEFAVGDHEVDIPPHGQKIYKVLSPLVEQACRDGILSRHIAPERHLIFFDDRTWHRGAETTHHGFRFFVRATRDTAITPVNEIRTNAMAYMPVLDEGW